METPPLAFDPPIVGSSRPIARLRELILKLAPSVASVLITGESGVGKELVARNLHRSSRRGAGPFVAVNCAALNPGVLESELFGHGKGAFTGAVRSHAGLFEQAEGGTLFLDEIGEVPPAVQAKLLRALQDGEIRRMGASGVRSVDVRVLSATNADLEEKIRDGSFRTDLFYRLNVVEVHVPPLRERGTDLLELVMHFFVRRGLAPPRIHGEAVAMLSRHKWPGNVRELENELERMLAMFGSITEIYPAMLSERVLGGKKATALDIKMLCEAPLPQAVGYLEENLLKKSLAQTNWNKSESARMLGLSRQGLLKKIKRYGITRENARRARSPRSGGAPKRR